MALAPASPALEPTGGRDMERAWRPAGRNAGHLWRVAPSLPPTFVPPCETPPEAGTRWMGPLKLGAKTIVPSLPQLPPRPLGASQIDSGGPPEASILRSFVPMKKAMERLSGDQKGYVAFSVP